MTRALSISESAALINELNAMKKELAEVMTDREEWIKKYIDEEEELEVYGQFAQKFGDLSCCYDAKDVTRIIQGAFDQSKKDLSLQAAQISVMREFISNKLCDKVLNVPGTHSSSCKRCAILEIPPSVHEQRLNALVEAIQCAIRLLDGDMNPKEDLERALKAWKG